MFSLGPLGFTAPWLLATLVLLPVLWILLRAVPPAPLRRRFPGVILLLGLADDDSQTDRTPWWLLVLRLLALAAVIIGFSGPVLNPQQKQTGNGPLLVLIDGTWASARDWPLRQERLSAVLNEAGRAGRPVALMQLSTPLAAAVPFQSADIWQRRLAGLVPQPFGPTAHMGWPDKLPEGDFETYWMSDGVERPMRASLQAALLKRGPVSVFESATTHYGLRPAVYKDGAVVLTALRLIADGPQDVTLAAIGTDPLGVERILLEETLQFEAGAASAELVLTLPPELRNRVSRFEILGQTSAAGVALTDDVLKRREVALISGREQREGLELLSPLHYLTQALAPNADLIDGAILDVLPANPDAIVLADVAQINEIETAALLDWVREGGLLLRFAGARLAASDVSRTTEDPLMPVRLRAGGRSIGGAMSWGAPKSLRPFGKDSPFFGLSIPEDVEVSAQVMAQPDPALAERVIAALSDGTPLVTRKHLGAGQVILFHVTANAEWSSLPLSGLFVQMLERLAVSTRPAVPDEIELAGTTWVADKLLNGFGDVLLAQDAARNLAGVAGEDLALAQPHAALPPGVYRSQDRGHDRAIALNVLGHDAVLVATDWPSQIVVHGLGIVRETGLKGAFLLVALAVLVLDILATLWVGGRLLGVRQTTPVVGLSGLLLAVALLTQPNITQAQSPPQTAPQTATQTPSQAGQGSDADIEAFLLAATAEVVLAHVLTGDTQVDQVAMAGLRGLSDTLFRRTSIEPAEPIGIDVNRDELSVFPFLYWPISTVQSRPSPEAYAKLNRYLRSGGMILFDTRDADVTDYGGPSARAQKLQQLARPLHIPPLELLPSDHVLTRTFYLLQDFPGRFASRKVWVEAAPVDAEQIDGMPFRNLNDGVTPVVIGGNDWAAAWAVDRRGNRMFPVGRGFAGEQQRELAMRFGVNLIMHVLTGNYKSDQVHVPALLDRLGQ